MSQFQPQRIKPPSPASYRATARKLRRIADVMESHAAPQTSQEKRILSLAIHGLAHMARVLFLRHNRLPIFPPHDKRSP